MKYLLLKVSLFLVIIQCTHCTHPPFNEDVLKDASLFHANMRNLTDIIVYDIFSPPVASRIYLYPCIAAYEILAQQEEALTSLQGKLNGLKSQSPLTENINKELSALYAFNMVGKALIFSTDKMEEYDKTLEKKLVQLGVPFSVRRASKDYAKAVAENILNWAAQDFYNETRTYPKYSILKEDKFWKPTPPDYMDGIEPHWNKIRPAVLDSVNQFKPTPPLVFDLTPGSPFQLQLQEVYEVGNKLDEEQIEIAKFWGCNPYVTHHRGHAMFATKKITPGGHWIGITAIASRKAKVIFLRLSLLIPMFLLRYLMPF